MVFGVGDEVTWVSQAGGHSKRKQGVIVQVVRPGGSPNKSFGVSGGGLPRKSTSYVVKVGSKHYWPFASKLSPVEKP